MNKLSRIREFIVEEQIDWVIVTDSIEARYITDISSSNITLCISLTESHLFTDFRYRELAGNFCRENNWDFHELKNSFAEEIASVVSTGTAAIQSNFISLDRFESLAEAMPNVTFLRLGKEISAIFSVKSSEEISKIEAAAAIADRAFALWQKEIELGMNERQLANRLEHYCREQGSREQSFETIVLFGARAALPHGRPSSDSILKSGDTILVDFGCAVDGFCSDMTRTFFFGSPNPKVIDRYSITLTAQLAGLNAVRAGVSAADVDSVVRNIITEAGYGEQFGHGTGHGVGLRIHEQPALNSRDTTILREGMIVTVEPGIYVEGESGVRIEDLLMVTATGYRLLSHTSKILTIL